MTTKKTLRAAGAALVAAGIALGAVTPAIAAPSSGANWDGDNRGAVLSASIADADRERLAEVGFNLESIEIVQRAASTHDIELNWDVDESAELPEELTPILNPDGTGIASSMMLGVKGQNIYEKGKYPAGSPAGTFSRNIPLDFVANTPERSPAKMSAASLSSWRPGSADAQPAVESWNIDKYQTLDPLRESATEAAGLRGHFMPNLSQCYDNTGCGFWVQPAAYGMMDTAYGSVSGMLTLTDPIWVSVHTTQGVKTPANYVDDAGYKHTFTIDPIAGAPSRLADEWVLPEGVDDSGRVDPRLSVSTPYYRESDGKIALGFNSTVGVTQTVENVGTDQYRITVTPSISLEGRSWDLSNPGLNGVHYVPVNGESVTVVMSSAVQGDSVVITANLVGDGINPVPAVDTTSPVLDGVTGGLAQWNSTWTTLNYAETVEFPEDPTFRDAVLNLEVQVENTYGGTLAPEDIPVSLTGTVSDGSPFSATANGSLQNRVQPGSYQASTPEIAGYVFGGWECSGIGWEGTFDEASGEFIAAEIPATSSGVGLDCVRVYVEQPPVVEEPVAPPVVEEPVVVPPVAEEPPVVEEPTEPVFNEPFRPETGVEDVVSNVRDNTGQAAALAASAAALVAAGSVLLLRSRRQEA